MIYTTLIALIALQSGPKTEPAFQLSKQLVGGEWKGEVVKNVPLQIRFTLEENGQKLVGKGTIGAGTKHPTTIYTSFGWDAETKTLYYLDQHGFDTVYFGHVTKSANTLDLDFNGLVGDPGHYRSHLTINGDSYDSTIEHEKKDGTWEDLGIHLTMHRVK